MTKLTKNFDLKEFNCKDNSETPAELIPNLQELANNLQILRDFLGTSLHINSGYRSHAYNKKIGGAKFSQHLLGKAADISSNKFTPEQIHAAVIKLIDEGKVNFGGVGIYNSFLHVDIRKEKARWELRTKK